MDSTSSAFKLNLTIGAGNISVFTLELPAFLRYNRYINRGNNMKFVTNIELDENNIKDLIAQGIENATGNKLKVKAVYINVTKLYGYGEQPIGNTVSAIVELE